MYRSSFYSNRRCNFTYETGSEILIFIETIDIRHSTLCLTGHFICVVSISLDKSPENFKSEYNSYILKYTMFNFFLKTPDKETFVDPTL